MATTKGRITIPRRLREQLDMKPGDAAAFELAQDGRVILVKVDSVCHVSRFGAVRGCAGPGLSTDETMALTRGDPPA
jgi:antitoxin PrlF